MAPSWRAPPKNAAWRWRFEAAVAGGIPVIKALREGLAGNRITARRRHPERHLQLHPDPDARARAASSPKSWPMRRSWATPRPTRSFDIDGIDAAHKLAILAALAFGRPVAFDAGACRGHPRASRRWTSPSPANSATASSCWALRRQTEAGIETRVHPCMVPETAPIARVDGVFNAVVAEGDFVGRRDAGGARGRGRADRLGRGRGPDRHRAQPADAGLGRRGGALSSAPSVPMSGACRPLLPAPDGGGSARRDRRRHRHSAGHGVSLESRCCNAAGPGRGGAGGAGDARNAGKRDARGAGSDRRARAVMEPPTLIRIETG